MCAFSKWWWSVWDFFPFLRLNYWFFCISFRNFRHVRSLWALDFGTQLSDWNNCLATGAEIAWSNRLSRPRGRKFADINVCKNTLEVLPRLRPPTDHNLLQNIPHFVELGIGSVAKGKEWAKLSKTWKPRPTEQVCAQATCLWHSLVPSSLYGIFLNSCLCLWSGKEQLFTSESNDIFLSRNVFSWS